MDLRHLVKQCQSGDREAFGILYQTYLNKMHEIVAYYIHNSEVVWDILHDGFLIAFVSIDSLRNASKIEAWLTSIMKNLALQYLKEESNHISLSLSDVSVTDDFHSDSSPTYELTWEELNRIINLLPEGYGKVFRLAVLDGLSHKEIGALLGIAPHSSSSQLAHAKAMLRRMITKYKVGMGILSIAAIILILWYGQLKHKNDILSHPILSNKNEEEIQPVIETVIDKELKCDNITKRRITHKPLYAESQLHEKTANITKSNNDSIAIQENDSLPDDTMTTEPSHIIDNGKPVAKVDLHLAQSIEKPKWSLSLAYTGNIEQNVINRYKIPTPGIPDMEAPSGEIEVTEKSHHYVPLVVGLSLNKSLTSRWSIETGLRYTLLRSDFHSDNNIRTTEMVQRIHYIGVPVKFNYRIFTHRGISLYGQGGGTLDIPVYGRQYIVEYFSEPQALHLDRVYLHAPLQWSAEGGLGIQYHLTPSLSIYAEPSFYYYFNPRSDIKTIRQEKPIEFSLPIGIKITW